MRKHCMKAGHGRPQTGSIPISRLLVATLVCGGYLVGANNAVAAGGDTQATATCIAALPYSDSGTTVGATDDYDLPADVSNPTVTATCATIANGTGSAGSLPRGAIYTGTGTGPDVVYKMSFPAGNPDTLTITMDPTGAEDLALIVYCDTCSSSLTDGLAVSDAGAGGIAETVTVGNIAAGSTLYIVVDGYSTGGTPPGPSGAYTLSVTSSGATQPAACGVAAADLSITKTDGVVSTTPGGSVTYTVTASNAGPDADGSVSVADTFPAACSSVSYTSVGAGGATGNTAAGTGNIAETLSLPAGASVTYTATCAVSPAATGSLANTATIAGSVSDPAPANNSATDTDTLVGSADLSITKTDGVVLTTPGDSVTYTITAANAGPSNDANVSVTDTFPAACSSVSYTSVGAGGATGNTAAGTGNIAETLSLPVGASVTYTATCAVSPAATGSLANTATITGSVSDPTPANNSATDTDAIESDGVATAVEDAGPNGGDGNGDGIPDSQQSNVATLLRPDGGYITLGTTCGAGLAGVQTYTEASQGGGDPLFNIPYGLVGFSASCNTATFTVYYHGVSSVAGMTYRKYGPTTPGNIATLDYYTLPGVVFGTSIVGGQTVATATFTLNDNQLGDDTGLDNVIVDQGGVGVPDAAAIPTLSEWGMILLSGLVGVFGLSRMRRRKGKFA